MNAIIYFAIWVLSLLGSPVNNQAVREYQGNTVVKHHGVNIDPTGVHIMNGNPRTVVALEDTHFNPR